MVSDSAELVLAIEAFADAATAARPRSIAIFPFAAGLEHQFRDHDPREIRNRLRFAFRDRDLYWREMGTYEEAADRGFD